MPLHYSIRLFGSINSKGVRALALTFQRSSHGGRNSSFRAFSQRQFASNSSKNDEKETTKPPLILDASLRGVGQVLFLNSPSSGAAILAGLAVGDPYLAFLAATGTLTATAVAQTSQLDQSALTDGLWGYNGCLIGCAAAVFLHPMSAESGLVATTMAAVTATVAGAGMTPFVAAALKQALGSVPQFTLAFNMVALTTLLRTRPLLAEGEAAASATASLWSYCVEAPLLGISQIFVVESIYTAALVLGGIAMYSRGLALHTLVGSSVGAATGVLLGADAGVIHGLWGYNSALTSLGVGVFFVHSPQVMALSVGGAAGTAAIFGGISTVFGAYGSPCLTLPFCLAMSGCYLLKDAAPGLKLAQSPHSPEQNI